MIDIQIQTRLAEIHRIQPLNPVMMQLLEAIQDSGSEAADLKRIIDSDANTSATILKIANSPFYGMSGRIRNVRDACVLLGHDQLRSIIYTTALDQATNKGPHPKWRESLRLHALASAIICHGLSKQPEVPVSAGSAYSLGLLHELGKQVLVCELTDIFEAFMSACDAEEKTIYENLFAEAGAIIAEKWRLPESFKACISHCHTNPIEHEFFHNEIHAVQCAHTLAHAFGFPTPGTNIDITPQQAVQFFYPEVDAETLTENIQQLLTDNSELSRETRDD